MNEARSEMAAECARRGQPISAGERDWAKLALCDKDAYQGHVIRAMEEARAELVRDRQHGDDGDSQAIDALDAAIARMKAHGAS